MCVVQAASGPREQHRSHGAHAQAVNAVAHHPSDPHVYATASADGTAAVWDARAAENGGCVARMCPCAEATGAAPLAPTADAYRSFRRKAKAGVIWDSVDCCKFDQSGRWLALGCADGSLRYFSLRTREITGTLQLSSSPQVLLLHLFCSISGPFRALHA